MNLKFGVDRTWRRVHTCGDVIDTQQVGGFSNGFRTKKLRSNNKAVNVRECLYLKTNFWIDDKQLEHFQISEQLEPDDLLDEAREDSLKGESLAWFGEDGVILFEVSEQSPLSDLRMQR